MTQPVAGEPASPALEFVQVTKRYGSTVALRDLSLSVGEGEVLGLLGPNGAGKTTALRLLVGYLTPTSGRIRVHGVDASDAALAVRSMVGYLPEAFAAYPELRVRQYLGFVAGLRGLRRGDLKGDVARVVEAAGLETVVHRQCGSLSKGYRQRLGLAQALLGRPRVLVLDEPTSGLDPVQVVEARALIRAQREVATVVVSTHVLPEVAAMCTRVVVMSKGRLVADGTPETLARASGVERVVTVEVKADPAKVRAALGRIPGGSGLAVTEEAGLCRVDVAADPKADPREEIVRRLTAAGLVPTAVSLREASLEEVFLRAVRESE